MGGGVFTSVRFIECMTDASGKHPAFASRKKTESGSEFFSVGAPLNPLKPSYIRRQADERLFAALFAGRYAQVFAPDHSGKSSLLAATAARLETNAVAVAVLDLAQLGLRDGGSDAGRFYYSVAYRILRQLRIRFDLQTWWQDKAMFSNRQRLHEFYSDVVLRETARPVVVLIDEVQCVETLPFTDQLLTSIRSAYQARTGDPEFTRLTFALCGEGDPSTLVAAAELSPFHVTESVPLKHFTREELAAYRTELKLSADQTACALDRIYDWTGGQPYLTQKLCRAVARETPAGDIDAFVDGLVVQQFTHRASLGNEPMLSHVHRRVIEDSDDSAAMLNLYGRIRKGIGVPTDLGSAQQRRLLALGLLELDDNGNLGIPNRIFAAVFTARWANENQRVNWRTPVLVAGAILAFLAVPFWYTQGLPRPYANVLNDVGSELDTAETAWLNLRSFPGHSDAADKLYTLFVERRAELADTRDAIDAVVFRADSLPRGEALADRLLGDYHDRTLRQALRYEDRDAAIVASLEALVNATPERRQRAARLIGADYPELIATLGLPEAGNWYLDRSNLTVNVIEAAEVRPWFLGPEGIRRSAPWAIMALEVTPLVRRVVVDRTGVVNRASLELSISHARHADLRIKVIAPSGKTVELATGVDHSSHIDTITIPAAALDAMLGESLTGTWSLSIRDERPGVAGHLVGWDLTLNSQGLVEDFQRGLDIPDPLEVPATNLWISDDARYALARATRSDSARLWDLAFAKPVRALPLDQSEVPIGLDAGARRLVTATLESVNLWDTARGDRTGTLPVSGAGTGAKLTADGAQLFVQYPGDVETRFELWSLATLERRAALTIAGAPALVAIDDSGTRLAAADFDQSVRVWDFAAGALIAQLNLRAQPSALALTRSGDGLGIVYGRAGASLWTLGKDARRLFEVLEPGDWDLEFSPSGLRVAVGRPATGYRILDARTGQPLGPPVGLGARPAAPLAFSDDQSLLLSGGPGGGLRLWRAPGDLSAVTPASEPRHAYLPPAPDILATATADGRHILTGDQDGHLHVMPADADPRELAQELSFLGHASPVTQIAVAPDNRWAATAAADNTVRVWSLIDGQPRAWVGEIAGSAVNAMAFSPDATVLAVLSGTRLTLLDRMSGDRRREVELSSAYGTLVFVSADRLYLGGQDGVLSLLGLGGVQASVTKVWQGEAALSQLTYMPRRQALLIGDSEGTVRQFDTATGDIGRLSLVLPARIREIAVAPFGARIFVRTERWVHEASSGADGLVWSDAYFVPPGGSGQELAFVPSANLPGVLHVLRRDLARLTLAALDADREPLIFGEREDLVMEWRRRLGLTAVPVEAGFAPPGLAQDLD